MTLAFSTQINGKPNYFPEKIIIGLYIEGTISISKAVELLREYNKINPLPEELLYIDTFRNNFSNYKSKLHTIRVDAHDRWKQGNKIHPVINNRTPQRFQFVDDIPCTGTQSFQILWEDNIPTVYIGETKDSLMPFFILEEKGVIVYDEGMSELAQNDGFDTMEDFFNYFNTDFTGKLIHWTDKRY